ncbi:hypothetical protein Pth03_51320 [Planotetraspora thailandica]|uniref:Uncharacterized protein n=1 Tax=Planotetraspora thailandica TaxID=487172 RepID=A0A8J3V3H5_9ACTN|nr:hypothetical protein [Planotetraspora thailandica]GII56743.1 hypothetical protein Pth03_51320 [Planotetraspora thailandica]
MNNGFSAMPLHRPTTWTARRTARTVLRAVVVLLCVFWAALGVNASASAADGDGLVKVFVVNDPGTDTLQSIAAATLSDPGRAGEIFQLNRGRAQRDGGALNDPSEQLHPGWILRLPPDASGPGVQLARDSGNENGSAARATTWTDALTIPLPAAVAVLGALVLALVTAGIMARQRTRRAFAAVSRLIRTLSDPGRRRRGIEARRSLSKRFAADADSVRRAYGTLDEFSAADRRREKPVHALRVDDAGVTVWLSPSDAMDAPWTSLDTTRWRRQTGRAGAAGPGTGGAAGNSAAEACLVRAGADADGQPVFVDLSRLDGVLSVTGDHTVAREAVQNLLAEVERSRPYTPVTVLRGTDGAPPLTVPPGLQQVVRVEETAPAVEHRYGTVRGAASRRPVKGLVVMAGTPTEREAAELAALCGPGGAGWTGLVCGEVDGAHWRWYTDAQGEVDIPVLGVKLTVPA